MRSRHFTETELKLAVAAGDLPQLLARLSRYGAPQRGVLDSLYFDTRDRRLAAAGLALRLRL
ncbi:MAG: CYTH domain-containing protein, partial [Burkholderiaceae bacterium]|nr:CYTH domain-containing protein [Burkholderiaceae bacterium]